MSKKKQAIWNGQVIAESDDLVQVEGNYYFPADSIQSQFYKASETKSVCPWKGTASYYTLEVDGQTNKDAVWFYPETKPLAKHLTGRVAFWKGVEVK